MQANWRRCKIASDCALQQAECCPKCQPATLEQAAALHPDYQDDYRAVRCKQKPSSCGPEVCAKEPSFILPMCIHHFCSAVDFAETARQCERDEDCKLRWGDQCCASCKPQRNQLVAVHTQFPEELCGGVTCSCAAPPPPKGARAVCSAEQRRCEVRFN